MAHELKSIDITGIPELVELAREVGRTKQPTLLRAKSEKLAVLFPAGGHERRARTAKTRADMDAFLSAAGTWSDIDTDALVRDIADARRRSSRPPVEL